MAAIQASVDKLVREFFEKQNELQMKQDRENAQPQPFSQFILVQYFLDEFNSTHDEEMPLEEKNKEAVKIALEVRRLMGMTVGQIKEYFRLIDEKRIKEALAANDRVIFDYCLIREISSKKELVGQAREDFRRMRVEAYQAGTFDYSIDDKRTEEILIRMEDVHFPEGSKKLQEVDYSSTYDKLIEKQLAHKEDRALGKK